MLPCAHCTASLAGMRSDSRFCSAACRRASARQTETVHSVQDAAAVRLLLRQTRAVRALLTAQRHNDPHAALAATRVLHELSELTTRLFGAPTPQENTHD